jgi:methylated-DNA-[protein]-cysteine S-methyltransferase
MQTQIFETALGLFGIGWTDSGIARVHLPGLEHWELAQRLAAGGAVLSLPTREVEALMERIEAYAEGQKVDFSDVTLDLTGAPDFHRRAYAYLTQIGWGEDDLRCGSAAVGKREPVACRRAGNGR